MSPPAPAPGPAPAATVAERPVVETAGSKELAPSVDAATAAGKGKVLRLRVAALPNSDVKTRSSCPMSEMRYDQQIWYKPHLQLRCRRNLRESSVTVQLSNNFPLDRKLKIWRVPRSAGHTVSETAENIGQLVRNGARISARILPNR